MLGVRKTIENLKEMFRTVRTVLDSERGVKCTVITILSFF